MELKISSPCPQRWTDLVGDDRVRYCGDCKLNVYNLTVMKPAEIDALVRRSSGRLCGQLYVRGDRKATLRDCPTGRAGMLRRRIWKVASAFLVMAFGLGFRGMDRPDTSGLPPWLQTFTHWIDPGKPSQLVPKPPTMVGVLFPVRPSPPPPVPSGSGPKVGP